MKHTHLFALLILTLLSTQNAFGYHYQLMGSRSGGMGGSTIAFGADSASALTNPAGLARLSNNTISLAVSAYSYETFTYDNFFQAPNNNPRLALGNEVISIGVLDGNAMNSSVTRTVPASLAYVLHFGDQRLALSVLVPQDTRQNLFGEAQSDISGRTHQITNSLSRYEQSYYIGPSYARRFGSGRFELLVGASLFLIYSQLNENSEYSLLIASLDADEFATRSQSRRLSGSSFDLSATAGLQAKLGIVRIGAVIQSPSVHLDGNFEVFSNEVTVNDYTSLTRGTSSFRTGVRLEEVSGDFTSQQAFRVGAGIALELKNFVLAGDLGLRLPDTSYIRYQGLLRSTLNEVERQSNTLESNIAYIRRQQPTLDISIGSEYGINNQAFIRIGGFLNMAPRELNQTDPQFFPGESIDTLGVTLGGSFGLTPGTLTSLSLAYIYGIGESEGFGERVVDRRPINVRQNMLALLVSGNIDLKKLVFRE